MSSFHELRKRCRSLHLKPCSGKGVNKEFLEKLLGEHEEKIEEGFEYEIKETNPELYSLISSLVPSMPSFHTEELRRFYGLEKNDPLPPQDNWRLIYNELESLSRQSPEGEADLMFFEALINDSEDLLDLSKDEDLVLRFLASYPDLIWLLERIGSSIWKIYVALNQIEKIREMDKNIVSKVVPFIRTREVTRLLLEKNPKAKIKGSLRMALPDQIGESLWFLEKGDKVNPLLMRSVVASHNREIIFSFLERLDGIEIVDFATLIARQPLGDVLSIILQENSFTKEELLRITGHAMTYPENLSILIPLLPKGTDLTDTLHFQIRKGKDSISEEVMKYIPEDMVDLNAIFYTALDRENDPWINYIFPKINIDLLHEEIVFLIVDHGKTEIIKDLLKNPGFSPPQRIITESLDSPDILLLFLTDGRADPTININNNLATLIYSASVNIDYETSLFLLLSDQRVREAMDSSFLLRRAINDINLFKRIYEVKPITSHQIQSIAMKAAEEGHTDVVKYLLPFIPQPQFPLYAAIRFHKKDIVNMILNEYPRLNTKNVQDVIDRAFNDE